MSWWWMERRCQQLDHRRHLGSADCWLSWLIDVADLISRFLRVFFDLTLPSDVDVLFFTSSRDPPATFRVFLTFDERTGPAAIHFVNHKLVIHGWKQLLFLVCLKVLKFFLRTLSNNQRIHFFSWVSQYLLLLPLLPYGISIRGISIGIWMRASVGTYIGLISIAECSS